MATKAYATLSLRVYAKNFFSSPIYYARVMKVKLGKAERVINSMTCLRFMPLNSAMEASLYRLFGMDWGHPINFLLRFGVRSVVKDTGESRVEG